MTTNEAVPVGARTTGRDGKLPKVKNAPAILMELTVRGFRPLLVIVMVFLEDVVIGTPPKATGVGVTVMPMACEVTVKAFVCVSASLPVVTVTVRTPGVAAGSILRTAVALVKEFTVSETTVIPEPKLVWLVP